MTIEVATYINDLQPVNPASTDQVSQGDDHLRLIKTVLQNTFTGATRAYNIPTTRAVTTTGTLLKADGAGTVYVSTAGGAVVLTMPTLVALDAGWAVNIVKTTSDVNPVFVAPPSGNISSAGASVARARRCVPFRRFSVVWDGTNWFCERINTVPIGSTITFWGAALPAGFEWPNGQTLASVATNYPEYNAVIGSGLTPDVRSYAELALDNLGGSTAAGRLPAGYIAQTTLGAAGGGDTEVLTSNQMPSHYHSVTVSDPGHVHTGGGIGSNPVTIAVGSGAGVIVVQSTGGASSTPSATTGVGPSSPNGVNTTYSTGGGVAHPNLQPSIMCNKILVVE